MNLKIFWLGDFGTRFYIILKGKAALFSNRKKDSLLKAQAKLFEDIEKGEDKFELTKEEEILFNCKEKASLYFQGKLCLFEHVATLGPGDYFGETCNLTENTRTASVFAEEDLYMLWMNGKDYLKYFNSSIEETLFKQKTIAKIFPDFTTATIKNIAFYFKKWEFPSGRVIYDEGDRCEFLGYLTEGALEVLIENSSNRFVFNPFFEK